MSFQLKVFLKWISLYIYIQINVLFFIQINIPYFLKGEVREENQNVLLGQGI